MLNNLPYIMGRRRFAENPDHYMVMGASWDKGEDPTLTRTDYAVGKTAQVGVDSGGAINHFDKMPIFRDMREVEDNYGNVFIRIPKFYIKKVDTENFKSWQICLAQRPGFYRPWCFWDFAWNKELPYVDIGKYKASLSDDGQRLESKPDKYPLCKTNLPDFRTLAQNNNTGGLSGYQLLDIHAIDILRTLMFIEFGTLNLQSVMYGYANGRYGIETEIATVTENNTNRIIVSNATATQYRVGQTISVGTARYGTDVFYGRTITAIEDHDAENKAIVFDGDPVDVATGNFLQNTGWKNGFSAGIAASSGSIFSNSDGKYPCMYRGIESPYADLWQWADGVNINDHQAWICADADNYASNVFANPYEQLGYVNHNANNYAQEMGYDADHPFAEFPVAVQTSFAQYYCDYYYQSTGQRVALFGGGWNYATLAGPSCWYLSASSGSAYVYFGGRLLKKAL